MRYSLIAALTALGLYAMLIVATSLLFNGLKLSRQLDTGSLTSDAFFGTAGDVAAIYNRSALSIARPQVILVGGSNFQKVLASDFDVPGFAAANISVDGSGVAEFIRLVDLAYESVSPDTRGRNIFVIGVWYGEFCNLHGTIMQSLNQQLTRYGLYRFGSDNSVVRTIPRSLLSPVLTAIRPLLVEQRLWGSLEDAGKSIARFAISGDAGPITVDQLAQNTATFDVARRQTLVEERKVTCSRIDPANFAVLDQIVDRITREGDRAMIVDLPIPQWHADGVPMFAAYQRDKVQGFSSALSHEGAGYLNLQSSLVDDDFYDSVHPKPLAARKLSRLIVAATIKQDGLRYTAR
jgi:hypothetical protein